MSNISFVGQVSSTYLFGRGRGKDKKKRKGKNLLKESIKILPGTNTAAVLGGLYVGRDLASKGAGGINQNLERFDKSLALISIGATADKLIHKEKLRFKKEGIPRSRVGKIVNDAKIGARSTAGIVSMRNGIKQFARPGTLKSKALKGIAGAIYGGAKGAVIGGSVGSGIGVTRGFLQPNKKKKE